MSRSPKSPDDRDREIGELIRQLRHSRRLTQAELGTLLGITFQQVQKYEKGTNRIASGRLEQVAKALGVPITVFFEDAPSVNSTTDRARLLIEAYDRLDDGDRDAVDALVAALSKRSV